jgi:hypothetical protein
MHYNADIKKHQTAGTGIIPTCKVDNVLDENRIRLAVEGVIRKKPRGHLQI